jgi:hypothetical protein
MRATYPAHLLLDLIILIIFGSTEDWLERLWARSLTLTRSIFQQSDIKSVIHEGRNQRTWNCFSL